VKNRENGNSVILLIIAISLVIVGSGFLLNQKIPFLKNYVDKIFNPASVVSENTDLVTYKNSKWGYQIKYSKNFSFKEILDGNGILLIPSEYSGDNSDGAISITAYHKSGDEITSKMPLSEYAKNAAPQEIQNYESLASIETITTTSGDVGYITTWNRSGPRMNGVELNTKNEPSEPITYFDPAEAPYYAVRVELRDKNYLSEYEQVIKSYSSK